MSLEWAIDEGVVGGHAVAYQSHSGFIVETLVNLTAVLGELAASQAAMTKLRVEERMLPRRTSKILRMASMECVLRWESCVTTAEEVTKRMKLQVRKAQESLDCSR